MAIGTAFAGAGLLLATAGTAQAAPAEESSPSGLQCLMTNTDCPSGQAAAKTVALATPVANVNIRDVPIIGIFIGNGADAQPGCVGTACNGGNAGLLFGNGGNGLDGGTGGNGGFFFGRGGNGGALGGGGRRRDRRRGR
ncbi:hypothetical protein [Mycobacterium sp. M26]|uniref:hypothetical protein n=1 Tax=Mycobacterium sp. M26 TaxID=1762962 RepID=UPI00073E39D3|nr:hypothetical protein [Mycobacterium sp. M26]